MPITDQAVNYFRSGALIEIGTVGEGAETRLEVASFSSLGTRYDDLALGTGRNTTLSAADPDGDGIIQAGDSFTVSSTNYLGGFRTSSETISLELAGTGTYTTYALGVPVTRTVLIGETPSGAQYVVFPDADAPVLTGQLVATLDIHAAGYDYVTGEVAVCYLQGTRILTDHGYVAIEDLREGDMVVCRFGGLRPIRWIGRQHLAGRRAPGQEAIRFAPGSIAEGMPRAPLLVSPGHSMLVGETLVLAAKLVNGITITREPPRNEWSYFQLDLGDHDLVLAEGAWSESFADCRDFRQMFDNAPDFRARFPDHVAPVQPILCAERPSAGAALHRALRHVAERALSLEEPVAPGPLEGRIEGVAAPCHISGWAADAHRHARPIALEVVLDGEVIGTTLACAPCSEAEGRMGFVFDGALGLTTEELARLLVRRAQDRQAIAPLSGAAFGRLQGHLDLVTDTCCLKGWARDRDRPDHPVMLEVVLGEEVLGIVLASRRRQDLQKAGLGDVAFVFEADRRLSPEEVEAIQLRRIGDHAALRRSERTRTARPGVATAGAT